MRWSVVGEAGRSLTQISEDTGWGWRCTILFLKACTLKRSLGQINPSRPSAAQDRGAACASPQPGSGGRRQAGAAAWCACPRASGTGFFLPKANPPAEGNETAPRKPPSQVSVQSVRRRALTHAAWLTSAGLSREAPAPRCSLPGTPAAGEGEGEGTRGARPAWAWLAGGRAWLEALPPWPRVSTVR